MNLHDSHLIKIYIYNAKTKMLFDSLTKQKFIKLYKIAIIRIARKTQLNTLI